MRLSDFAVLSFDCYGTLIDWESGIVAALTRWLAAHGIEAEGERVLAAFSEAEAPQQEATPGMLYRDLLAEVHGAIAEQFGLARDPEAAAAFGASIAHWPAFPDSAPALRYLKQHYQLVILSNVDRASFAQSSRKLGVEFDAVFTAEDIGSYKPDPRNFEYMLTHLAARGITREQILHTAESLYHDHVPARRVGLATCWIHRRAGKAGHGATRQPEAEVRPDFRFESLGTLAAAHRAEQAG
jgi:2-haloalkanoic acid dehalogenase type II